MSQAHPPRSFPWTFEGTKSGFLPLQQSTEPFFAGFTTLLSMWRFTLPSSIVSPHIPSIQIVNQYSFVFPRVSDLIDEPPAFVLVLSSLKSMPQEAEQESLRQVLLSDETGSEKQTCRAAREQGIHVIPTWKWNRSEKKATIWLRKDVLDKLNHFTWGLSIWRTESWVRQAGPMLLDGGLRTKARGLIDWVMTPEPDISSADADVDRCLAV